MTGDIDINRNAAQLAVFEASRSRLFSLAYRILGVRADAEDVVQDTFVKWHLHQHAPDADVLKTPAAWLATVAKRTAIDRLRRMKHELPLSAVMDGLDGYDGFDPIDQAPSAQLLAERASDLSYGMRRVLERLSAEERAAFLLREAFEEDYASIARVLNRSAAHCRQIVHRAKDRIRDNQRRDASSRAPHDDEAIQPLLDAIARQDVNALVTLTLAAPAVTTPATTVAMTIATTRRATHTATHAAMLTQALITRLRIGRIDLCVNTGQTRVTDFLTA
jgi:RNA polymerase sigma factor (sigma-70 family)